MPKCLLKKFKTFLYYFLIALSQHQLYSVQKVKLVLVEYSPSCTALHGRIGNGHLVKGRLLIVMLVTRVLFMV